MKRLLSTGAYNEYLVLPDEFPDSAIMMLLGVRHLVKQEWGTEIGRYSYILADNNGSKFDLKVVPDFDVPLPDMSDPKDLAINELQSRIKELEAKLRRMK